MVGASELRHLGEDESKTTSYIQTSSIMYIYNHIYIYTIIYGFPISCLVNVAASRLFGDQTRMSAWVPDALREVRLWSHSTPGCPWILLAGIGLLLACCCWCLGFLSGALAFSLRCRRCVGHSLHLLVAAWSPVPVLDLRGRLAEYRRDS